MTFKLHRHPDSPIMLPDLASDWECYNVFNPSVIYHRDLFHMHYRAQGLDWISRIGYAQSKDGIHWNRLRQPVLEPIDGSDMRGVEDPRLTEIEGEFYMTYTAYGRDTDGTGKVFTIAFSCNDHQSQKGIAVAGHPGFSSGASPPENLRPLTKRLQL